MIDIDLNSVATPLNWAEVFVNRGPIDIDIGAGKGRFLNELATRFPDRNFLAVERSPKYHKLCCERAARRGLANVRLLRTTAEDLFFRLLEPASVDRIFVLFPDPWPKKRHHKRRLIKAEVVAAIRDALKPGGLLLVKSDHHAYAEVIAEVLAAAPGFNTLDPESFYADLPVSGFEYKYRIEGRSIHRFALEKTE